jgi:hypothetical protein
MRTSGFPCFQVCCAAFQKLLAPTGQHCGGYTQFARKTFRDLPAQQLQHRCNLRFADQRPPAVTPFPLLLAHIHFLAISDSFSSQFGVQENPRARSRNRQKSMMSDLYGSPSSSFIILFPPLPAIGPARGCKPTDASTHLDLPGSKRKAGSEEIA